MSTTASDNVASIAALADRVAALEREVLTLRDQLEQAEVMHAVNKSLREVEQGAVTPLRDADARFRSRHGLPQR